MAFMPAVALALQAVTVPQHTGTEAEYRGLSVAGSEVVWATARNGVFSRTGDGGTTWHTDTIPGGEGLFLVDVHAVDAVTACVLGTSFDGGLARIYYTTDGGEQWTIAYENTHEDVFFDGLAFWSDERGVAFSDPVDGAFLIVRTEDGCRSWVEVPRDRLPQPLEGEAGFAASGTAITVVGDRHAWIGTGGGATARVLRTTDGGRSWTAHETPLEVGATAGVFGLAFQDPSNGVAVGGDYRVRTEGSDNVIRTRDGGVTWEVAGTSRPRGVRYGVAIAPDRPGTLIAVGPSGYGFSTDWGATWMAIDTVSVNTVALSRTGMGWVAGVDGKVWRITFARD